MDCIFASDNTSGCLLYTSIKTLNARYMGNFLVSMSVKEPLFPNYSD